MSLIVRLLCHENVSHFKRFVDQKRVISTKKPVLLVPKCRPFAVSFELLNRPFFELL